jgi:hypothetical protein
MVVSEFEIPLHQARNNEETMKKPGEPAAGLGDHPPDHGQLAKR